MTRTIFYLAGAAVGAVGGAVEGLAMNFKRPATAITGGASALIAQEAINKTTRRFYYFDWDTTAGRLAANISRSAPIFFKVGAAASVGYAVGKTMGETLANKLEGPKP